MHEKHETLIRRTAYGKFIGFLFGALGLAFTVYALPETGWDIRFGVLFFGLTLGAVAGCFSIDMRHPWLALEIKWWVMGPAMGAWLCLVLVLFIGQAYEALLRESGGWLASFASPLWLILDGAIMGLVVAIVTHARVAD